MTRPELRGLTIREFIGAIEHDGFVFLRSRGSHLTYGHADGRQITVSFHRSGATFKPGMLRALLRATRWTDADLRRLGLVTTPPPEAQA